MATIKKVVASVIIVVKNDRGIATTLDHLRQQRKNTSFEVIVVDGSQPGTLADIREQHQSWVTWDQYPYTADRTTPQQRNRGMELARSDIIVFIDANCIPADNWLRSIVSTLHDGRDIVCGPVDDSGDNNLVHYARQHDVGRFVDVCTTINVGFKRQVIERIGGFDNSFSWGQDIDFFWRAGDAGFKIYYEPQVAISHDWGKSGEQLSRAFSYGKARAHLYKKHWRTRYRELLHEPHVAVYPLFILGLPLTYFFWPYPLLLFVPVLKNRHTNPFGLVLHHLAYGLGVLAGIAKPWPKTEQLRFTPLRNASGLQQ